MAGAGGVFRKVVSGQPLSIPAPAYNAFIDAAMAHRRSQAVGTPPLGIGADRSAVLVRNDTGAARSRLDVLALGGALVTAENGESQFLRAAAFAGTAPTAAAIGRGVVLLEPVGPGRIGRALADGVGHARVRMVSEQDRCADVDPASPSRLRSCEDGSAQLLWVQPVGERDDPAVALAIVRVRAASMVSMHARITSSTVLATNRWRYSWQEVRPNAAGTAWVTVSGGFTQATHGYAYNAIEAGNNSSGVQGNGVNLANLPGTFALQPLGANKAVVELRGPYLTAGGVMSWWISAVNAVDGACS